MKMKRGSTSIRRLIFIADTSQTDGSGLTNLLHNSSGLVAYYFAGDLSNEVQITLVTATLGTYTSGGFIAVDNTNMPGWYEIGIPDAALDGGNEVAIQFRGAANMAPVNIYIELDAVNYQVDAFGAALATNWTATRAGYLDGVLIAANYNQRTVSVTGANHVAADIHELQPAVINNTHFDVGAIDASAIAADAITSSKLAADSITSTQLATTAVTEIKDAIATITPIADLATMITNDGTANARYTVSALQNGPSGEGGSTINVYPVSASTPERVAGTTLTFYKNENRAVSVVTDFTLTSLTLQFVVEDAEGNDILTIADGSISRSSQTFTVTIGTTVTGTITNYKWSLRDITSGNSVLARGVLSVQDAAAADA